MSVATGNDIDPDRFRAVLGRFPTGLVAVTAHDETRPLGFTIGSFASISLEPPLVGFFVAETSSTWPQMSGIGSFCVNVLADRHTDVCTQFSRKGVDRFADQPWIPAPGGSPILHGALAWLDCQLDHTIKIGDHELVVGRVTNLGIGDEGLPLLFFRRSFGVFHRH